MKKAIQQPLITGWWTISALATLFTKNHTIFFKLCSNCVKNTTTADKTNVIASNLIRMYKCDWILADVFFLSGISGSWMNRHLKWYQGKDSYMKSNGYLSFQRLVRYYLMIQDIDQMAAE